jgi:hypothetical protein
MIIRVLIFSLAVCTMLGLTTASAEESGSSGPVDSRVEAATLAAAYIGEQFITTDLAELQSAARVVTLIDSTTPFLSAFASSDRAWRVKVNNVVVAQSPMEAAGSEKLRDFEVYIDSLTGRLLKIQCFYGDQSELAKHPISAEYAEDAISRGEVYGSVPDEIPDVSFIEALWACGSNWPEAKAILGQYVVHQDRYIQRSTGQVTATPPVAVWAISLAGIPPMNAIGYDISYMPDYTRNRVRMTVNATTGRLRMKTGTPSVPLTPEDKERIFPDSCLKRR